MPTTSDDASDQHGLDIESIGILIRTQLWAQILVAMVLGLGVGLLLSPEGGAVVAKETAYTVAEWLKLPGSIFLNLIQMVVVALVTSSITLGICSSGDPAQLKRLGMRIFPYFVFTTCVAVTLGIVVALLVQPGNYLDATMLADVDEPDHVLSNEHLLPSGSLPERIANLIPTNIDQARVSKDMLQIVIYAIITGIAIVMLPAEKTAVARQLLESIQDIALKIVGWAMMLAPYAVFGLLADIAIRVGLAAIVGMSAYVGAVLLGLMLLIVFYLIIVGLIAHRSPLNFLAAIRDVQLLAFSTSSSAAVMPLSMQTAEDKLDVDPSISKFIIPLGATINMDGTAIYQVIAALFLCQVFGIELTTAEIVLLSLTTVGASIGSPSTPGVGIVILATIVAGLGVPAAGIALIIGVDRILDMARTAVNVTGDLTATVVMDRWLK